MLDDVDKTFGILKNKRAQQIYATLMYSLLLSSSEIRDAFSSLDTLSLSLTVDEISNARDTTLSGKPYALAICIPSTKI